MFLLNLFFSSFVLSQLTETQSESSYYSPQKVKSREVLLLEHEGITIEVKHTGVTLNLQKKSKFNNVAYRLEKYLFIYLMIIFLQTYLFGSFNNDLCALENCVL